MANRVYAGREISPRAQQWDLEAILGSGAEDGEEGWLQAIGNIPPPPRRHCAVWIGHQGTPAFVTLEDIDSAVMRESMLSLGLEAPVES